VRVTSIALGSCNTPLYAAPLDKEASKPSAPSVEQDERVEKIRKVIGQGFQPSVTDCRALLAVIDARAASTSANVAQGAETVAEDVSLVRELQKALFYWMPSIAGEDSPAGQKAAEHAYLLVGLNDNSLDCYGDQARASLGIANRELERIGIACSDAGCPDEMEVADFIDDLYARAALTATVAPAVDAQPVAIYQTRWSHPETVWGDVTKDVYDRYETFGYVERRTVYASAQSEGWRKDAERYRWLVKNCFDWAAPGDGDSFDNIELHFEHDMLSRDDDSVGAAIDAEIAREAGSR
jgi:hypothetical protein